jgi:hypothetical protein
MVPGTLRLLHLKKLSRSNTTIVDVAGEASNVYTYTQRAGMPLVDAELSVANGFSSRRKKRIHILCRYEELGSKGGG